MTENRIRALQFEIGEVGKHLKGSKLRYLWVVAVGERIYNFVLDVSTLSGKIKLSINGKIFHQQEQISLKRAPYQHGFIIDGCYFNLVERGTTFELYINNKAFSHMINNEKAAKQFVNHQIDQQAFSLDSTVSQKSKKITLQLPGVNGMKKKKANVQSDNWNQFANKPGFPNFFESQSTSIANGNANQLKCKQQTSQKQQIRNVVLPPEQINSNLINPDQQSTTENIKSEVQATTYDLTQIPSIGQINLAQFNTMQNLFATVNQSSQITNMVKQSKVEANKKNDVSQFNTIQNLFATIKIEQLQKRQNLNPPILAESNVLSQINNNPFNTLQNLFATNGYGLNYSDSKSNQIKLVENKNPTISNQPEVGIKSINFNDFSTMQNLFATNSSPIYSLPNQATVNEEEKPKIRMEDFNTMQNLFKTNGHISQISKENESPFWKF